MKASFTAALGALGATLPLAAAKVSYEGYKAFHIDSQGDLAAIDRALEGLQFVQLSCEKHRDGMDIAIAPESLDAFQALGLTTDVITEDVAADFAREGTVRSYTPTVKSGLRAAAVPDLAYFEAYHDFEGHTQYLNDLQAAFPDNSEIFVAGESGEGRSMQGIHIWGSGGPGTKQAIVWHGTVHAREWIVAPTLEYLAYKLVDGYLGGDEAVVGVVDNYDFYIMPIVNPDGFAYTQSEDRLWRKNRQVRDGASCDGTDVNRNWPYQWDVEGGSSTSPCAEDYRGEAPGDTPENAVLTNHTLGLAEAAGVKLFIDWHSFSQLILLPYGYTCSSTPDNLDQQMTLAGGVADAIRGVNGLDFVYGPTCETIYQTAGGSNDWAFDIAGVELAWAVELRPTSGGANGFIIPPENIVPSGEENWAGMQALFASF